VYRTVEKAVKQITKPEADELAAFSMRIYMMLRSGITLSDGLSIMLEESTRESESVLLKMIQTSIDQESSPFFAALQNTGAFPVYFVKMVEIGELSGRLEQVTQALSIHYRREAMLLRGIRQTIIYPVSMAMVLAVVVYIIMTRVLPMFEQAYRELGSTLTPVAQLMMRIGRVAERSGAVLGGLLGGLSLFGFYLLYTRGGRARFTNMIDSSLSKGKLGVKLSTARFTSGMALMLASGTDIEHSLRQSADLVTNEKVKLQIAECAESMERGISFTVASVRAGLYTGLDAGLLSSGFAAGNSDTAMQEIADRCSDEVSDRLDRAIGRIEPILVATLSLIVGIVLLSVMLPLIGVLSTVA